MWLNYKDDTSVATSQNWKRKKRERKKKNLVQPVTTYWEICWNFSLKL